MQIIIKENNFIFILYFEMCKNIIFIFLHGSNMCFVWKVYLRIFFVYEK